MEPVPASPSCILVVDDQPTNRALLHAQLTPAGHDVTTVASGEEALARFAAVRPDLVLLDVMMPGLDGFETCRRLRALPAGPDVAVIFLTALNDLESYETALAASGDDFLTKPIHTAELHMRVRSLLRVKRLGDSLRQERAVIRRQHDELRLIQAEKDDYIAFLVHDLKNMLTTIQINGETLCQPAPPDVVSETAGDILVAAAGMRRRMYNLLDISQAQAVGLTPRWAPVDVGHLLQDIHAAMFRRAAHTGQILQVDVDPAMPSIEADEDLISRIIENLADNALKYSPPGSRVLLAGHKQDERSIEIMVRDEGMGVADQDRARIFAKYAQLSAPPRAAASASRGLGLAFCQLAASALRGDIAVEPNHPRGTTFRVRLPIRP